VGDYKHCAEAKDKAACEAQAAANEAANKKKSDAMINALIGAGKSEAPPAPPPDKPSKQITDSKPPDAPKEDTPSPQITESKPPDAPKKDVPSPQITESKPPPATTKTPWKPGDQIVPPKVPQWVDDEAPNADAKNDALHAAYTRDFKRWEQQQKAQAEWDKANPQAKNAVADTPTKDTKAVTNTQAADASASANATAKTTDAATAEANAAQDAKVAKGSAPAVNDGVLGTPGATAEEAGKTGNTPPPPPPPPKQTIPKPKQDPNAPKWPNPAKVLESNIAIDILSVPTGAGVSFGAFVTSYTDSYKCNWNSVNASGRMDPIQTFQNTQRVISIEWDVVAGSLLEAWENLDKCQRLVQMMYPTWATGGKEALASSLDSPPYFKFKFANLASSGVGPSGNSGGDGSAALASGLFGTVSGVDVSPDFDQGVYTNGGSIYPKLISLSLEITVLHEHALGFARGKVGVGDFTSFPYQISSTIVQQVRTNAEERALDETLAARASGNPDIPEGVDPERAAAVAAGEVQMTDLEVENLRRAEAGLPALPTQLSKAQQAEANKTMQDTNQ